MISAPSPNPFGLSLSKPVLSRPPQAAAEGAFLPQPSPAVEGKGFDRLSPNGFGVAGGAR